MNIGILIECVKICRRIIWNKLVWINDILYVYLQSISYIDKVRFLYKSEVNFSRLEQVFKEEFKRLK